MCFTLTYLLDRVILHQSVDPGDLTRMICLQIEKEEEEASWRSWMEIGGGS
jgi:hypothetical protein